MSKDKIVSFLSEPISRITALLAQWNHPSTFEVVRVPREASEDEVCKAVTGATVILTSPFGHYLNRRILKASHGIKLIQFGSVGYENIDLEAATELKIPVANNPGWNAVTVAEHALMMMLVLLKKAFYAHQNVIQGRWGVREELFIDKRLVWELQGKTLGILGLGAIGKEVAKRARAFGANIIYNKRSRLSDSEEEDLGVKYAEFDQLLAQSDILSIHVPLTDETRGVIGRKEIAKMKERAILINTSRRDVVDEAALAEALREGGLSGAGIDVPCTPDEINEHINYFQGLKNVVLTPHIAGATEEAITRAQKQVGENISKTLTGVKPLNIVNEV